MELKETLLGFYRIRALRPGEIYTCSKGCGECSKIEAEDDNVRIEEKGVLKERQYSIAEVTSCCEEDLIIWNEKEDREVTARYYFLPIEVANDITPMDEQPGQPN